VSWRWLNDRRRAGACGGKEAGSDRFLDGDEARCRPAGLVAIGPEPRRTTCAAPSAPQYRSAGDASQGQRRAAVFARDRASSVVPQHQRTTPPERPGSTSAPHRFRVACQSGAGPGGSGATGHDGSPRHFADESDVWHRARYTPTTGTCPSSPGAVVPVRRPVAGAVRRPGQAGWIRRRPPPGTVVARQPVALMGLQVVMPVAEHGQVVE